MDKRTLIRHAIPLITLCSCLVAYGGSSTAVSPNSQSAANWRGLYAGINGGLTSGNADKDATALPPTDAVELETTKFPVSLKGGIFGAQLGYNWLIGSKQALLVGVETDFNWSTLKGDTQQSVDVSAEPTDALVSTKQQVTWLGTLRPRVGFIVKNNTLFYVTGGLAYGHIKNTANTDGRPEGENQYYQASTSVTKVGWVAGAGIELASSQKWSVKLEYLYYDLGDTSATADGTPANPPFQVAYTWRQPAQLVRLGINYHF
jgi:outer membrane immunogenic protein